MGGHGETRVCVCEDCVCLYYSTAKWTIFCVHLIRLIANYQSTPTSPLPGPLFNCVIFHLSDKSNDGCSEVYWRDSEYWRGDGRGRGDVKKNGYEVPSSMLVVRATRRTEWEGTRGWTLVQMMQYRMKVKEPGGSFISKTHTYCHKLRKKLCT